MKLANYTEIPLEEVNMEGAKGAKIRWLISQKDKAENFALRMFEIDKDGHTPYHIHEFEHEVFVLEGEGMFVSEWGERPFKAWDTIFVEPNVKHQFKNVGDGVMRFLCIVPIDKPKKQEKKSVNPFANETANNC